MKRFGEDDNFDEIRRRVIRNGASLLKSIVNWHMDGSFDNPESTPYRYCGQYLQG